MDCLIREQLGRIHASPVMAAVVMTGGGSQALDWLLGEAGASRTIIEARVPYAPSALVDFLGYNPESAVSLKTARDMAALAYRRAVRINEGGLPLVGIASTAAIATDRPRRGHHRCYVAAWTGAAITSYNLTLIKGLRDRRGEDRTASLLVLRALSEACGVDTGLPLGLDQREHVKVVRGRHEDPIALVMDGKSKTATVYPDGSIVTDQSVRGGLLPGSFNPLHLGHERMAEAASRILGLDVTFELAVTNVDKPSLEEKQVRRRLGQFEGGWPVVLTRAPVFREKAKLFPGCTFVIGWDTAVRIVDPRYYGGKRSHMLAALEEMRGLCCRFLVAGREEEGIFRTLENVDVPSGFEAMFIPVPEVNFRYDESSTHLRKMGRGGF